MDLSVGEVANEAVVHGLMVSHLALVLSHYVWWNLLAVVVLVKRGLALIQQQIEGLVRSLQAVLIFVSADVPLVGGVRRLVC